MSGPVAAMRVCGDYHLVRALDPAGALGPDAFLAIRRGARPGDGAPLSVCKFFAGDAGACARLLRELPRLHRLKHPAITRILECFEDRGRLVVVLEHHDGLRLTQVQEHLERENERLADAAIWYIAHQLLGALGEAHRCRDERGRARPIVHGHLSPDTVHVDWDGTTRIVGLGLAPLLHDGAPAYRAPELDEPDAKATPVSDVYALAAILWTLLAGRRPPEGAPLPSLAAIRPELPATVAEALERALERRSAGRTIGCDQLQESLEQSHAVVSEPAELRWNMELLRAASLFSHASSTSEVESLLEPAPLSSLPALESLADESTDAITLVTRHYRRGGEHEEPFFDPETTLPADGAFDDAAPTLTIRRPPEPEDDETLIASAPLRPALPAPFPTPPPPPPPAPAPPEAPAAVHHPPSRPLAGLVAAAALLVAIGFAAGWWLKPDRAAGAAPVSSIVPREPLPLPAVRTAGPAAAGPRGRTSRPPERTAPPLSADEGYLLVRSPLDAHVFVQGVDRGKTNQLLKTTCATRYVRLRDVENSAWLSEGRTVEVACGATTTITLPE